MSDDDSSKRPLLRGLLEASSGPWKGDSREFNFHVATPMRRALDVKGIQYSDGRLSHKFDLSDKQYGQFVIPGADDARSIAAALWLASDAINRPTGRVTGPL